MTELKFILEVEDDWPPVAVEGLPCTLTENGFRLDKSPLFIKSLSVGDVITVTTDHNGYVTSWSYVEKSGRSTIWLLRLTQTDQIGGVLSELRDLGCFTVELAQFGCYSIDVPAEIDIALVDSCLSKLDENKVAVAYPSFRHSE